MQTLPVPRKGERANPKSNRCTLFFCSQGIVHKEFVPPGQNVNQTFYRKSLKDSGKDSHVCDQALHPVVCCTTTRPPVTRQSPSTNFWLTKAFLWFLSPPIRRISVPVISFYSPSQKPHERAPFWFLDNFQKSVTDAPKVIPAEAFQYCYEQWKQRPCRCVAAKGNYFEADNLDL